MMWKGQNSTEFRDKEGVSGSIDQKVVLIAIVLRVSPFPMFR